MTDQSTPVSAFGVHLSAAVVAVLLAVAVLSVASGAVAAQEGVDVSLEPADSDLPAGEESTFLLVVEGASSGVAAYNINVSVSDPGVAEITGVNATGGPQLAFDTISDDGALMQLQVAMGVEIHEPAEEIPIAEITLTGTTAGESATLGFDGGQLSGDNQQRYTVETAQNATFEVVESSPGDGSDGGDGDGSDGGDGDGSDGGDGDGSDGGDGDGSDGGDGDGSDGGDGDGSDGSDGSGPGFGIVGIVAALAGASYLRHTVGRR